MPDTPPARILIVDDEEPQLRALCDTLQDHNYETFGFNNGEEALAALRKANCDLLLADLMMPGMDGITLLQKAMEIDPALVGIIMTGEGTITTAVDAMKSGALDYMLKPFRLSVILPVLSRALSVRRLRTENAELHRNLLARTEDLEFANKELEAFAFSVSHDLRAPLRAINSYSQIVIEDFADAMPEEGKQYLDKIVSGAQQMNRLIDDIMRFSHLSRQPLTKRPCDLMTLVKEAIDEVTATHTGKPVKIHLDNLPGAVVVDPPLIKQVLINLVANAFKFTQQKEAPEVTIGSKTEAGETAYFVRDNGAGFDMAYAKKLFTAFHRMHSTEEFEGTGIGLSIVHRIIQRHGGRVWADAAVGKGAAFYFTLP